MREALQRLVLVLAVGGVGSALAADLPGSRDLEVLPRFPASQIVDFREVAQAERIYPQGSIRRISGRLRYEREILAQGSYRAVTYELPRTHTAEQAFNAAREVLLERGSELLYWCQGRECGASSLWANAVFGNATLYGSDEQQAYALLRLSGAEGESLLSLYSITRGNRRAYLHVEQLKAASPLGELLPTPETLLRQLRHDGRLKLPEAAEPESSWAELLARCLSLDSTVRVSLSGTRAGEWHERLKALRIGAVRLELGDGQGGLLELRLLR